MFLKNFESFQQLYSLTKRKPAICIDHHDSLQLIALSKATRLFM